MTANTTAATHVTEICALLSVWDMPTTVRFYCDLLGFEIEQRSPAYAVENRAELFHWCRLSSGGAKIMLNTEYEEGQRPAQRPPRGDGRFGVWFYFGCPDIDAIYAKLKEAGVECDPPRLVRYGGSDPFLTLTLRDPDGHGLTLQRPAEK